MTTAKTWLVTGSGRGLGRALALAAARSGDRVVATVRRPGSAPEHENVVEHLLDVRDRAAAAAVVQRALDLSGRLDVLVNNAGYGLVGALEEVDEASAREVFETNLFGPMWLVQAALPVMRAQGSGRIVQISTVGAVGTMPTLGLYNATKWALEAQSEALAQEVAGLGVRVSIVEPGEVDTQWATGSMRFAQPDPAYDALRRELFGTPDVPWATSGTGGGTSPDAAAAAVLQHVHDGTDQRLRVLVGDDAPAAVATALSRRLEDYRRDPRFESAWPATGR
jgi:NAD(P)-dependent dehydrogenase (short-subunit alcohol dehydrogenase family)